MVGAVKEHSGPRNGVPYVISYLSYTDLHSQMCRAQELCESGGQWPYRARGISLWSLRTSSNIKLATANFTAIENLKAPTVELT